MNMLVLLYEYNKELSYSITQCTASQRDGLSFAIVVTPRNAQLKA